MCTNITIKTIDNQWVTGRTNEFAALYKSNVNFIPRNYDHDNFFETNKINFTFKNEFSYLAINAYGIVPIDDFVEDGLNEKGLSVSVLYFKDHKYKEVSLEDLTENNINYLFLSSYILGNFASVKSIRENIKSLEERVYWEKGLDASLLGVHFAIVDKTGDRIVIEPENEKLVLKENPIGVMTNSPSLEYHYQNLRKYSHLTPMEMKSKFLYDNLKNHNMKSQGNGLFGLPGDFTSDSRFVRAAILSSLTEEGKDIKDAVRKTFQVLHTSDILPGYIVDQIGIEEIKKTKKIFSATLESSEYEASITDHTNNFIVKDLSGLKFYYKTWNNISPRYIDLDEIKDSTERKTISICQDNTKEFEKVVF